jgi:phosphate uptake regulator
MSIDRRSSLTLLADVLERVLVCKNENPRVILQQLPSELHSDVVDVLSNVEHFMADGDIRRRDEAYKEMQETQLRQLIAALRRGDSREALLDYSFLSW